MYTNNFFFCTLLRLFENSLMNVDNRPFFDSGGLYISYDYSFTSISFMGNLKKMQFP